MSGSKMLRPRFKPAGVSILKPCLRSNRKRRYPIVDAAPYLTVNT
jgi:hypothetical protein